MPLLLLFAFVMSRVDVVVVAVTAEDVKFSLDAIGKQWLNVMNIKF